MIENMMRKVFLMLAAGLLFDARSRSVADDKLQPEGKGH